ncbi:MAG: ATP-binding cassette domain-containing protein [Clostridiales bacterium]|nr:ATP-binding cassette domain-containing protein [Clostridiales bacterium]
MVASEQMQYKKKDFEIAVSVENVQKTFKDQVALQDINISFTKGKIHGIIGRNGSGKTVLLKCICGLLHPDSGEITVNNKIIGKEVDFSPEIGFIIEVPGFLTNYSGYRNLKYLASIRNLISDNRIRECMQMVGLDPDTKKHVGKYSLGMRQRLGIAQAIMENPEILIFDEPLNSLDNHGVEEMHILFKKLRDEGKTIILTSHNKYDIEDLCDTVAEMDGGKLK